MPADILNTLDISNVYPLESLAYRLVLDLEEGLLRVENEVAFVEEFCLEEFGLFCSLVQETS